MLLYLSLAGIDFFASYKFFKKNASKKVENFFVFLFIYASKALERPNKACCKKEK